MDETLDDSLVIEDVTIFQAITPYPYYGTIEDANKYFAVMLHGELWDITNPLKKYKALVTASQRIDQLRFAGEKTDEQQVQQFPRNGDTVVPDDIKRATYEVALALLEGVDPDTEYGNLTVTSRGFGPLRTSYDLSTSPDYIKAGIPNLKSWKLLLPYLNPNLELRLRRMS